MVSSLTLLLSVIVFGWILLTHTSASLLLPSYDAARDRCKFALSFKASSRNELKLKIFVLLHLLYTYTLLLPCVSYLWMVDEVLYGDYTTIVIERPVITVSVPRAGTTSFHRTLALDEQFVTPTMLDLVLPFLCLQKLIYALRSKFPVSTRKLEVFLKWINRVTPEVEARHPISLFVPDADDILLGEWHWCSVGAVRTFPVVSHWKKHYQMTSKAQRKRSLALHQRMCQKVLYLRGNMRSQNEGQIQRKRLLLRSHLSPCIQDFQELYPDATFMGILRDPEDVLRSFAGLSKAAVYASTGVGIFERVNYESPSWSTAMVEILSDMMRREADLYDVGRKGCHHVKFCDFKRDPVGCLESLYEKVCVTMTPQMKVAIRRGLERHETYKTRHFYQNPSLQDLGIDRDEFLHLPGVEHYYTVLQNH